VRLSLYFGKCGRHLQPPLSLGAKVDMPLDNQFLGDRYGS